MLGRILLPSSPELSHEESVRELKLSLEELKDNFVMQDYYINPHNNNEYIVVGESDLFQEELSLHHVIDNGYNEIEMWLVREHKENEDYEYKSDNI